MLEAHDWRTMHIRSVHVNFTAQSRNGSQELLEGIEFERVKQ